MGAKRPKNNAKKYVQLITLTNLIAKKQELQF